MRTCPRRAARRPAAAAAVLAVLVGLVASVGGAPPARATLPGADVVHTYEVRGWDNAADLEVFAAHAAETLADDRGWNLGGTMAFARVPEGGAFTLWLAAPHRLPAFSPICTADWSCRVGRNVVINEDRFLGATPAWLAVGGTLRDYQHMVVNHEVGHWLGLDHARCPGPGQPAPLMQQQSKGLAGCTANAWPLPGERGAVAAARGLGINDGEPFGWLDLAVAVPGGLRVAGWALDPDAAGPVPVHVWVDGTPAGTMADRSRPDVGARWPRHGPGHGFDVVVPAAPGVHHLCAYALNVAGFGSNPLLGCAALWLPGWPFGALDVVAPASPGTTRVAGWAIDPDTTAPIAVHVYAGGRFAGGAVADRVRTDVAAARPGYGPTHGFDLVVPVPPGTGPVCAYGIDTAGGDNPLLGCA